MDTKHIHQPTIGQSQFLIPTRSQETELLDAGVGTMDDVRQNLAEMWYMNKLFGGVRAVTRRLYTRLLKSSTQATILELGTGSGRLGRDISTWAIQHQRDVRLILLDISSRHLKVANDTVATQSDTTLIQADATQLPFATRKVDYVVSSLFLHHFDPIPLTRLLAQLHQSVTGTIIMSDITRSHLSLLGFRMVQPLLARHYLTKHDGLLSIRRAYTPSELRQIAQDAGMKNARVYQNYPWQMTLVSEQSHV